MSDTSPKAVRSVQLDPLFHLIKHQEHDVRIARLVLKVVNSEYTNYFNSNSMLSHAKLQVPFDHEFKKFKG